MDFNIHHLKLIFYCFKHLMECDHRYYLIVFSSPKLNTQVRFSPVRRFVRPSVCKLYKFSTSFPEPLSEDQSNLAQSMIGFTQLRAPHFPQGMER